MKQSPVAETLNLWSYDIDENEVLALALHPMQKKVNQIKLMDELEISNVECVCEVGVNLNSIIPYPHLHPQLSFVSGLGPRKSHALITKL
jgi:transcription elongation factor SPT6